MIIYFLASILLSIKWDFLPIRIVERFHLWKIEKETILCTTTSPTCTFARGGEMKKFAFVLLVLVILIAATVKNGNPGSEPVTMILLGAGLIGLAVFGRRLFFK